MKHTMLLNACRAVMGSGRGGSRRHSADPTALGWQLERAALTAEDANELCERLDDGDALRSGGAEPPLSEALRDMLLEYQAVLSERTNRGGPSRNLPRR